MCVCVSLCVLCECVSVFGGQGGAENEHQGTRNENEDKGEGGGRPTRWTRKKTNASSLRQ